MAERGSALNWLYKHVPGLGDAPKFHSEPTQERGVAPTEQHHQPQDLVEASSFKEAGIDENEVIDLELMLAQAEAPDSYLVAKSRGDRGSSSTAVRQAEQMKREMASRGERHLNDATFVAAWRQELAPQVQMARERLAEIYRTVGDAKNLARFEAPHSADASAQQRRSAKR